MDNAIVADFSVGIDFYTRMDYGVITDQYVITYVGVRIYFDVVTETGMTSDVRKGSTINVLSGSGCIMNETWLFNTRFLETNKLVIFFQKACKTDVWIVHQNKRGGYFFAGDKVFFYNNGSRLS